MLALGGAAACATPSQSAAAASGFTEISRGTDGTHHVPQEYEAQVVVRWGDPIFPDSPEFDPASQSASQQQRQFGYNNDFIGYWPLPSERGFDERALSASTTNTPARV